MRAEEAIPGTAFAPASAEEQETGRVCVSERVDRGTVAQSIFIAALSFFSVLLTVNRSLFSRPLIEHSDYAANALQIQNATYFRELLGNYSRWGFHHPGPAFFYCFAFGERILHDWLRVVPEAINAHILAIIALNTLFLFVSIGIFAQHCKSPLFVPLATGAVIIVVDTINRTITGSALVSIWMPHVLLCCFLLFATSCASVSAGRIQHLPIATFTGLMLMHGHVAQLLFVTILAFTMGVVVVLRNRRAFWEVLRKARKHLVISLLLVGVFATPPLLEVVLHKPNNLQAILAYMRASRGFHNSWKTALQYEISFLTFLPDPEVVLLEKSPGLFAKGGAHPYIVKYWGLLVFLIGIVVGLRMAGRLIVSPFLVYVALEIVIISVLFLYWGTKIVGGLFNFNGHFFYAVQLLALLAIVSAILDATDLRPRKSIVLLLCCAVPCLMFAAAPSYRYAMPANDDVNQIASAVRGERRIIQIAFGHDDWPIAVGVASRLKRANQSFCVQSGWEVMFGFDTSCKEMSTLTRLLLTHGPIACVDPCRVVFDSPRVTAELAPYPSLKMPFSLNADNLSGLNDNFYSDGSEGSPMWTTKNSSIRFLSGERLGDPSTLRVRVLGHAIPGRPVQVLLNGHLLGSITSDQSGTTDFYAAGNLLRSDLENTVSFLVSRAGPIGKDPRNLGFQLERVEFEGTPAK